MSQSEVKNIFLKRILWNSLNQRVWKALFLQKHEKSRRSCQTEIPIIKTYSECLRLILWYKLICIKIYSTNGMSLSQQKGYQEVCKGKTAPWHFARFWYRFAMIWSVSIKIWDLFWEKWLILKPILFDLFWDNESLEGVEKIIRMISENKMVILLE